MKLNEILKTLTPNVLDRWELNDLLESQNIDLDIDNQLYDVHTSTKRFVYIPFMNMLLVIIVASIKFLLTMEFLLLDYKLIMKTQWIMTF